MTLMLGSVWFAPDFGAAWLFAAGLSTNLTAVLRPAPAPCAALDLVAPRLVPAHAPVRYP